MPTNVIMPALGVAQQTGTLLKWLKAEGQSVTNGEPLMEIETDKATVEIEAAASGTLARVTAQAGDEVPVGHTIALILAPGEKVTPVADQSPHPRIESGACSIPLPEGEGKDEDRPATSKPTPLVKPAPAPVLPLLPLGEGRGEGRLTTSTTTTTPAVSTPLTGGKVLASPKARRIAREQGLDLQSLRGSGPEGSILTADVLRAAGVSAQAPPAISMAAASQVIPLTSMRRIVGQRMSESKQSAPHFYISVDIDMTAVSEARLSRKEKSEINIPSINDFILHACASALKAFPSINSSFTEQGIQQHATINIGMAVALDEGLVVPVIRNADRLSLEDLAVQSRDLADKAQNKKLFPHDYEGGTFTVSNLGMLGIDSFIAIINPPQCAILAVGRVTPRVVAEDGMFAIKSMMTATLSADHRVADGAIAARFLREIKERLETGMF
jgi:pyruvate dehydrogenase E2 component (dihydrolipoamide acetyltransferase)